MTGVMSGTFAGALLLEPATGVTASVGTGSRCVTGLMAAPAGLAAAVFGVPFAAEAVRPGEGAAFERVALLADSKAGAGGG